MFLAWILAKVVYRRHLEIKERFQIRILTTSCSKVGLEVHFTSMNEEHGKCGSSRVSLCSGQITPERIQEGKVLLCCFAQGQPTGKTRV